MFALSFLAGAFIVSPTVAYAANLEVVFEEDPLFDEANFLPGNEIIRTVEVGNNSGLTQDIIVEAINAIDDDGLGDVLDLVIKEGAMTLYSDTLGEFLRAGEVSLSALSTGASTTYSFVVVFASSADNDTQAANLGFDLCVGFEGGDTNCGGTVVGGEGDTGGGGGGGGGGSRGSFTSLEVFSEEVTETNTENSTAVIEWDSNLLSTSQVIYGKESEGPYSLNLAVDPYFGYPLGTTEDPTKVTHHVVLLTGLEIGATYVYRVVSRSSPPTVGFQYTFILAESDIDAAGEEAPVFPLDGPPTGDSGAITGDGTGAFPEVLGAQKDSTETSPIIGTQAAAPGFTALPDDFSSWINCSPFFLFFFFIILLYLVWTQWKGRSGHDHTENSVSERRKLFFFAGLLLSIFIAYLLNWDCAIIPLAVLAGISLALYLWSLFTNRDREDQL